MRHVFLYGPPGAGKSTVGRALAKALNLPFVDLDAEIERSAGQSVAAIMAAGEAVFRDLESAVLAETVAGPASVVALGGGALLRESNRLLAEKAGQVVFLEVDEATLMERLRLGAGARPLLAGDWSHQMAGLLERRREHYASFMLRVANKEDPLTVARVIQMLLGRFCVRVADSQCDLVIQPGGLARLGAMLAERGLKGPVALVSDAQVASLYAGGVAACLEDAGYPTRLLTFAPGEESKTIATLLALWDGFLAAGLERHSTVIALGGGVTGDLAGFAAATYLRGCAWVNVPTSLLAMADASVGGKTGCNLPQGKNLVGAFHLPRLVLADPNVLTTLPEDEIRGGLAEVVKAGMIADPDLVALCSRGYESVRANLGEAVRRAVSVKVQIVAEDFFEQSSRAALNLGHTVGHALEAASGYRLRHGQAVAIGLVVEARLAEWLGLAEKGLTAHVADILAGLGLPVEMPADCPPWLLLQAMGFDKKRAEGKIRFALPLRLGVVRPGVMVENLAAFFEEV
ncbi:MAG: 3-dehydroquinate synthase [Anaerolineales bacterium]